MGTLSFGPLAGASGLSGLSGLSASSGLSGLSGLSALSGLGLAGPDIPLGADALIHNRDGIVGSWIAPSAAPSLPASEQPGNLELWSPWVRAHVAGFELFSRIGFRADSADEMRVLHLDKDLSASSHPIAYKELVTIARPPQTVFVAQLPMVYDYADLRPDRAQEILAQIGASSLFLGSITFLHPERMRWTLELLSAALRFAVFVHMRFKHALACRRPVEYSPQVQPMISTPGHGTIPSGHATEAFIASTVLWRLLEASPAHSIYGTNLCCEQLMRLASRIAVNRTVAGVHFPADSIAGALLGLTLAHYFVGRCTGAADYEAWEFDGAAYANSPLEDFNWRSLFSIPSSGSPFQASTVGYVTGTGTEQFDPNWHSPVLAWLWSKALTEWS